MYMLSALKIRNIFALNVFYVIAKNLCIMMETNGIFPSSLNVLFQETANVEQIKDFVCTISVYCTILSVQNWQQ